MPCFARNFGCFMVCSEIAECGKSKQNLASYYYLLVVKLLVKRKGLLLRILLLTRQMLNQRLYGLINMGHNATIRIYSHQIIINLLLGSSRKDCIYNIFFAFSVNLFLKALSLYKTEKRSSSIAGKISSAKIFAQEFSNAFLSRSVRFIKLSSNDNCWQSFVLKDIRGTTFQK